MKIKQFKKRAFTLIELIMVIVLIGILAGMSLPKFIGVQRNAKVAAMVRDIDTLEKAIKLYKNDKDSLPVYDVPTDGSNLTDATKDMEDIYTSLKEVLKVSEDGEEYLYKINMGESSKYHTKTKYGHGKTESDFYVYSTKTDRVYYYGYLVNDKKEYQHNEVPISFNNNTNNDKVTKLKSKPLLLGKGSGGVPNKDIIYDGSVPEVIQNPIWSNNLNEPKMHDKDFQSIGYSDNLVIITWNVNLTNRKINFKLDSSIIHIKDKDGNNLPFIDSTGKVVNSIVANNTTQGSFIMPEGAKSIHLSNFYTTISQRVYEISETDNLKLPSQVKNVNYIPNQTTIDFSWDNPTDSDYSKTLIYKNGTYDGETTTNSFTSKGLEENKEYTYTLHHQNKTGNISNKTIVKSKTITDGVIWSNSKNDPKIHDKDFNSSAYSDNLVIITWTGDLTNRKINFKLEKSIINIKDANGNNLPFINSTGKVVNSIVLTNITQGSFIMPEGAKSIHLSNYYTTISQRVYEISETDNLKLPSQVSNVKYTANQTSINFTWDNPTDSDYSKTLIYREGVYDGETTSTSFIGKGLQEDKEYTYTLYHQNKSGNISNKTIVKAKTITDGVIWSNSSNNPTGHDKDLNSYFTSTYKSIVVNWTGNLTNKKINLKFANGNFYIKDENGNNLPFINGDGKTVNYIYGSSSITTTSFIMPENASYIEITSNYSIRLYELSD